MCVCDVISISTLLISLSLNSIWYHYLKTAISKLSVKYGKANSCFSGCWGGPLPCIPLEKSCPCTKLQPNHISTRFQAVSRMNNVIFHKSDLDTDDRMQSKPFFFFFAPENFLSLVTIQNTKIMLLSYLRVGFFCIPSKARYIFLLISVIVGIR